MILSCVCFAVVKYFFSFQNNLCEAFPMESDYEGALWKSAIVAGVGLTAIATILALQRS